jgi:hypothetical protein
MAGLWHVWLKDPAGNQVALFDQWERLVINQRLNAPGAFALQFSGDDPRSSLFELDGQMEFYRADVANGIASRLEFEGHYCDTDDSLDEDGKPTLVISGRGYNDLLHRRIVYAYAGSVEAEYSGPAEIAMKGFVFAHCAAGGANPRPIAGLTVEPDFAEGNPVRLARAYRNVLTVVQEIAAVGGGDFAVVGTGPATYEFRWYDGIFGTDRSATVIFAPEWGNMSSPRLRRRRSQEVNAVLVGGQGDGIARATVWREDAGRIADSPINRRESFIDQRQDSDPDGLDTAGDRALEEGNPRPELSFEVLQVPSCLYGLHYFLGDLVTAKFRGYEARLKIIGLDFTVTQAGETIKVIMADWPEAGS